VFGETGILSQFQESLTECKEKLASIRGDQWVECNGISFCSRQDFLNWYQHQNTPSVAIFLDALAYMHAIPPPVMHIEEVLQRMELLTSVGMSNNLEAAIITSFDTIIPSVFFTSAEHKTEAFYGGTYAWLARYLKSSKDWKVVGTGNGVSNQITDGVSNVTKRVTELRDRNITSDINRLSIGLCQSSVTFCHEFVRFINEQQEKLTAHTTYSEDQIWTIQLKCIQRIIEELSRARAAYMDVGRKDRGNYIWGMLMSWKIQQRYLNNRFRDDPAITAVLVQHILFQGQDEIVKKQLAKIDATAAQLEAHKQKSNSEVQKLKNEIAKLKEESGKTKK
jgi:hypothetical protein